MIGVRSSAKALSRRAYALAMSGTFAIADTRTEAFDSLGGVSTADANSEAAMAEGFSLLGAGAYGCVVADPNIPGFVVKLATVADDGYHVFVRWLMSPSFRRLPAEVRACFPVIYSSEVICGVRITVTERLKHVWEDGHNASLMDMIQEACGWSDADEVGRAYRVSHWWIANAAAEALQFALDTANAALPINAPRYNRLDVHSGNFMMRGSQVVCTDPFA